MAAIEKGSVCIKTRGRLAGKKVIVGSVEKGFATIEIGNKKKKCNIRHLFPTGEKK